MKLRFLGTRGEIEARTRRHRRHSSLAVAYRGRELMVDCGLDWRCELARLRPKAIVLTHAHPDHAAGLRDGAPCPVYATPTTCARSSARVAALGRERGVRAELAHDGLVLVLRGGVSSPRQTVTARDHRPTGASRGRFG